MLVGETVNSFRKKRGERLSRWLNARATALGRPLTVIDVGGRELYWDNVSLENVARIDIFNLNDEELAYTGQETAKQGGTEFRNLIGNGCALSDVADASYDIYHSNSVIEHVGDWPNMERFAAEAVRVAPAGWMQTPAWEFPVEPHLRQPFIHWVSRPLQRKFMRRPEWMKHASVSECRAYIDDINLLSRAEVSALFPGAELWTERFFGFAKSYVATWTADRSSDPV